MSDVFISYARSAEVQASQVAEGLRALGYGVWRDDEIPAHRPYAEVIEERLAKAKAVVVVWSADAAQSQWVRSEANRAREDGKLVQLTVDGARLPMPFDQIQCADLSGWSGDHNAAGWKRVTSSLAELLGGPAPGAATPRRAVSAPLLAVMAFDNLSGDPEMAYFSDGVSEEILETVLRTTDLKVIARASSFQFRGAQKAVKAVAQELGVSHLLDGSVRRAGQRVRISAQLVECASATTVWSDRFDRELSDVFALQDEIAAAVAAALKVAFAPATATPTVDPAAYDLYLRARNFSDDLSFEERGELFEEAVKRAPDLAIAWAWLASWRAHALRTLSDRDPGVMRKAAAMAAETALRLDPRLALAHATLSMLEPWGEHRRREVHLARALELSPTDAQSLERMSQFKAEVGRIREAHALVTRSCEIDPLYAPAAAKRAYLANYQGRYEECQALLGEYRARWPHVRDFTVLAANFAAYVGDWPRFEAMSKLAYEQGFVDNPVIRETLWFDRTLRDRNPASIERIGRNLDDQLARTGSLTFSAIFAAGAVGLVDEAFAAVDKASFADALARAGDISLTGGWSPGILFDQAGNWALIEDVRFVGLCAKLGLVDYWLDTGQWPDCADVVAYDFRAEAKRLAASSPAKRRAGGRGPKPAPAG